MSLKIKIVSYSTLYLENSTFNATNDFHNEGILEIYGSIAYINSSKFIAGKSI